MPQVLSRFVLLGVLFSFAVLPLSTASVSIAAEGDHEVATVAGGCFWCMESDFDKVPGVVGTVSGYKGGDLKNHAY